MTKLTPVCAILPLATSVKVPPAEEGAELLRVRVPALKSRMETLPEPVAIAVNEIAPVPAVFSISMGAIEVPTKPALAEPGIDEIEMLGLFIDALTLKRSKA